MVVKVRFFAVTRDAAGTDRAELSLAGDSATVADAIAAIEDRYPALAPHTSRMAFAVNLEYVARDYVLSDGDELALIPPVSGG